MAQALPLPGSMGPCSLPGDSQSRAHLANPELPARSCPSRWRQTDREQNWTQLASCSDARVTWGALQRAAHTCVGTVWCARTVRQQRSRKSCLGHQWGPGFQGLLSQA